MLAVGLLDEVELAALRGKIELFVAQVADHSLGVGDRIVDAGALVASRKKAAAQAWSSTAPRTENDKAREILILTAQAVGNPGAHRRTRCRDVAGVKKAARGRVRRIERVHRSPDAQVVGHGGQLRQQLADLQAGLALPV